MKKTLKLCLLTLIAVLITACGDQTGPANTENTNAENANTSEAPAAASNAAVIEAETKAYDAWKNKDGKYFDAPAANWVEGIGLTCDNPAALGYKAAGYNVAWGGSQDSGHDPNGVRGSGFNNIYPYFVT